MGGDATKSKEVPLVNLKWSDLLIFNTDINLKSRIKNAFSFSLKIFAYIRTTLFTTYVSP